MAPRVLVDATTVPADRGGVGRYVDGLLGAFGAMGADVAIVCQRADAERYGRMAPESQVVPGPTAIAHRPTRLAWEQTGLPLVAQHVGAAVIHSPYYTMPLRAGRPVVVTVHDATVFTSPSHYSNVRGTFIRSATKTAVHRAYPGHRAVPGDPRRAGAPARREPGEGRRRPPRCGWHVLPPAERRRVAQGVRAPGPARSALRRLPGETEPRATRRAWCADGRRRSPTCPPRPRW